MNKLLHIVCLDAPAPPDYGGAIEMYYKIKALAGQGLAITLHYFDYQPNRNAVDLKPYCVAIHPYKRKSFLKSLTFSKPHIVSSRISKDLIERLNKDNYPILLEGIHCTGVIPYLKNRSRKIVVRLHNDEAMYYKQLAKWESNFFKRSYYDVESSLLDHYQKKLSSTVDYATVSQKDKLVFKETYGLQHVSFIPAFIPWQHVTSVTGTGPFCLYHGNVGVAENEAAAQWLIQHVFSKTELPLIISGKKIPATLIKTAVPFRNISFKPDPTEAELETLIQQAQVHVLPDFNNTGVKLKLLHALFSGRFSITNNREFESTTVAVAQTPEDYMRFLKSFWNNPFSEAHIAERKKILLQYNNTANAKTLSAHLY